MGDVLAGGAGTLGPNLPSIRLLAEFILDVGDIARRGGSVLDSLILLLVSEANLAPLAQDAELQRRYASLGAEIPDEIRRPVSVSAVAASLGLPFETVRRRILGLAQRGEFILGPKGVLVPARRLASPLYVEMELARYERTRRLYHDLCAVGALPWEAAQDVAPIRGGDLAVRLCNRLLAEYYLRTVEIMMRRVGDPMTGFVVLALARANMEGLSASERAAPHLHGDAFRRPIPRAALAARLGLPAETVRRRLLDLEKRGYCRAVPGGMMITPAVVMRTESQERLKENAANLQRFMSRLARHGVLALWDDQQTADRPEALDCA